ncbi:hypothetical protein AK830_g2434 [Neonectria ditissima]|uniref:Zn(2)-C6 fungal-type domain-containing protein n=1 Tax=Neonectria ditissima TaxID=78410 RepID=A0A0P7BW34_9HYPO|nr:hypothetical protein AK830_g2434 [Neonectria ditissima]
MDLRKKACGSCRSRKIRCNRHLPRCSGCIRSQLDCRDQEKSNGLIWLSLPRDEAGGEVPLGQVLRRDCVFSDEQRMEECRILLDQIPKQNIDALLTQVDEGTGNFTTNTASVTVGPFGAFDASFSPSLYSPRSTTPSRQTTTTFQAIQDCNRLADSFETLSPTWPTYPFFEDLVGVPGVTLSDLELIDIDQDHPEAIQVPDDTENDRGLPMWTTLLNVPLVKEPAELDIVLGHEMSLSISKVQLLLKNYELELVGSLTPLKHDKPPWVLLHLQCALAAFSDLYMLGHSNDARASVLLSVLSASAYHLHYKLAAIPGAGDDLAILGSQCFRLAKKRLQACLQQRPGTAKVAKYKEILMAFLNLVTASVFSGQMQEARYFLLDAGRLINANGIQKTKKSKKIVVLHAIYVYMRVFEECAHPASNSQSICTPATDIPSGNGADCYSSVWKVDPRSETLLHDHSQTSLLPHDLEVAGMLEQIYGIPQNLFHLLWQTTALGNEVSELRYSVGLHPQISVRIKELEDAMLAYQNPFLSETESPVQEEQGPGVVEQDVNWGVERTALLFNLTEALHSALIIYFYRHVCDISLAMLQHYVEKTVKSLFCYESQKQKCGDTSPGICWPAFIAGCEANSVELREQMSIWLLNNAHSSGIGMFSTAHDFVVKVWRARERPGCENLQWKFVLASVDTRLVLS